MTIYMKYLWWDDFRVIYSANPRRAQLAAHASAYAPLLTTVGLPSNRFTNAYDWSGATATTLLPESPFTDDAAGTGRQYANAYLHTMKFLFNGRLDGSIPFCPYPNGWGFAEAEGKSTDDRPSDDARWIADRAANFERLGRHDDDLLPATFPVSGETVDPLYRGCTGYAENGIAANYAWWTDFWTAAKAYIDTAVSHTNTPVEIYDDCEFMGPNLNYILKRINSSESTLRMFDAIKADPRWDTELVNGTQTWADFFGTLTQGQQDRLNDTSQTNLFADGNTLIAEKMGVFRDTIHAHQIDQTMVKAAREVFGSRLRFACEYGIEPSSETVGTIGDRSSNFLSGRIFENRGPHTLPSGWGAAPVSYQLFGLRSDATGGNLPVIAAALGYTRTGPASPTFGADGGAAADGRLFNMARLKENIRRIRTFGVVTVPWTNYIPANGVQTGIVATVPMTTADHLEVLRYWQSRGVGRVIFWGDPARNYPAVAYWESDFGTIIDEILPNLAPAPLFTGGSKFFRSPVLGIKGWFR